MKTITLKADEAFNLLLNELAREQHTSKSAIIRDAVLRYRDWLEQEQLKNQLLEASLKTRSQHKALMRDMEAADSDGL